MNGVPDGTRTRRPSESESDILPIELQAHIKKLYLFLKKVYFKHIYYDNSYRLVCQLFFTLFFSYYNVKILSHLNKFP